MLLQAATIMHAETVHTRCEEETCIWVSYSRESLAQRADLSGWVVWARVPHELSQPGPSANLLLKAATIMHSTTDKSIISYGLATVESRPRSAPGSLVGSSGREFLMNSRS